MLWNLLSEKLARLSPAWQQRSLTQEVDQGPSRDIVAQLIPVSVVSEVRFPAERTHR